MLGIHFKHSLLKAGILSGATDIHCHALPGVDDGAPDEQHALQLLGYMQQTMGLAHVWLTPHVMQGLNNDTEKLQQRFEQFSKRYAATATPSGTHMELRLAAEYMMDAEFCDRLNTTPLPLGNRHLLVETSYMSAPMGGTDDLLLDVWNTGLKPVIAHPERYLYMDMPDYQRLHGLGYEFQLNLLSLSGYYGARPRAVAERLLRDGLYDYVGSDLHHMERADRFVERLRLTSRQIGTLAQLLDNNRQL